MMNKLEQSINYQFNNKDLLQQALTHTSVSSESTSYKGNYERLEFLGDAVLGLIISEFLVNYYRTEDEGLLAKRRAALICGDTIAKIATSLDIGNHVILTVGDINCGKRTNQAILENVLEALIGAIYLDGGLEVARQFVLQHWMHIASNTEPPQQDAKTALQQWAQQHGKPIPIYVTINTKGPAHEPIFTVEVRVEGLQPLSAQGKSKRIAEREAARKLLAALGIKQ
jgi:ribonuclease-3